MEEFFVCPVCGNNNVNKLGVKSGLTYCRACLAYSGTKAKVISNKPLNIQVKLAYSLTSEQNRVSAAVLSNFKQKINTLIYAVCGAGKTELVFETIAYALNKGYQVGFVIPRKEVVIEISHRLKEAFPSAKVVAVFGGHSEILEGNIITLTTHQLYRYPCYFDLLIFDEIDAFPYAGDFVLEALFKRSVKGNFVMLSATPSETLISEFEKEGSVVTLFTRFHNAAIPVPVVKRGYLLGNILFLVFFLEKFIKCDKPVLVFVPTIKEAKTIFTFLKILFKGGGLVHSKIENVSGLISEFKKGNKKYLVTTTVLERGVTVRGLQVIIYGADHVLYDKYSLIQIAGRVGRKKEESDGKVIFIVTKKNKSISECINDIINKNAYLSRMLSKTSS